MASNETMAKIRIQISGAEKVEEKLEKLKSRSAELTDALTDVQEKMKMEQAKGDGADAELMKQYEKEQKSIQRQIDKNRDSTTRFEATIKGVGDAMSNLSKKSLGELKNSFSQLQAMMKGTFYEGMDLDSYEAAMAAYKRVEKSIMQLSGKVPFLKDVIQRTSKQSEETLERSAAYITKQLNTEGKAFGMTATEAEKLRAALEKIQNERMKRAQAVVGKAGTGEYSVQETTEAIAKMKELQPVVSKTRKEFQMYRDQIMKAEMAIKEMNTALLHGTKGSNLREMTETVSLLKAKLVEIPAGDMDGIREITDQINQIESKIASVRAEAGAEYTNRVVNNAENGIASISDMERALASLKEQLSTTTDSDKAKKISGDIDILNERLIRTKSNLQGINIEEDKIDGLSLQQLEGVAKILEERMKKLKQGSVEYVNTLERLKTVKGRIGEINKELGKQGSTLDYLVGKIQNWLLVYIGLPTVLSKIRELASANMELTDTFADVRKVTGMTQEEVSKLSDSLRNLDTRVPQQKLMEMAVVAGKLGLSGSDVEKFARSSAIALTALEELDQNSMMSVMKLNDLLGTTSSMGVDRAMIATSSAINDLSQASSAAVEPIINFSRRFGGVAASAKMSTSDVLAFGATVDALGQPVEMSATAMNKFTTAILTNREAIARDTGLSIEYLDNLAASGNTTQMMVDVLTRLSAAGGIGEISKYMGDLGGDGARMTAVISALAQNVDMLQTNLELSNNSFQEGTSVMDEYNLKNETAAALFERMGNDINEYFVNATSGKALYWIAWALEKIVYALTGSFNDLTAGGKVANGVMALVRLTLVSLTFAFIGTIEKVKSFNANIIKFVVSLRTATLAGKGLKEVLSTLFKGNIIGIIATVAFAIFDLAQTIGKMASSTSEMSSAMEEANKKIDDESYKLQKLADANDRAGASQDKRVAVIANLNRNYGKYIGYLVSETANWHQVANAINVATEALRRNEYEKAKQSELSMLDSSEEAGGKNYSERLRKAQTAVQSSLKGHKFSVNGKDFEINESQAIDLTSALRVELERNSSKSLTDMMKLSDGLVSDQMVSLAKTIANKTGGSAKAIQQALLRIINNSDGIQDLIETLHERAVDRSRVEHNYNSLIQQSAKAELKDRNKANAEMEKVWKVDPKLSNKKEEEALASSIKNVEAQMSLVKQGSKEWNEYRTQLNNMREQQRAVMMAFIEAPYRQAKGHVEGSKWVKDLKDGLVEYETVSLDAVRDPQVLIEAFRRSDDYLKVLQQDMNRNPDKEIQKYAKKMFKYREDIQNRLKSEWGTTINSKYELDFANSDKSGSEDKGMQKAYQALLNQLEQYYNQRKQLTEQAYKDNRITQEQHTISLKNIEDERLQSREQLRAGLLGIEEAFNDQEIAIDQENYKKVKTWLAGKGKNFSQGVRADMEKDSLTILQNANKLNDELNKILSDGLPFRKLSRDYQQQLESLKLTSFFDKIDEHATEEADGFMKRFLDITRKTEKLGVDAFKKMVSETDDVSKFIKAESENQWSVLFQIAVKYSNAVAEARAKIFEQNHNLIEKYVKQDSMYTSLDTRRTNVEKDTEQKLSLDSFAGGQSDNAFVVTQNYKLTQSMNEELIKLDAAMYMRKVEMAAETYDRLIEQARREKKDTTELERMKADEIKNINADMNAKLMEDAQKITDAWTAEYDRRAAKADEYGSKIGEFMGVMASYEWNSVDDRKQAGEELLKYISQETIEIIKRYLHRLVKMKAMKLLESKLEKKTGTNQLETERKAFDASIIAQEAAGAAKLQLADKIKSALLSKQKQSNTEQAKVQQQGEDTKLSIEQLAGNARMNLVDAISGSILSKESSAAVQSATTSVDKAEVDVAAGGASAASKTLADLGWWGIPLIAGITAILDMLLNAAFSSLNSAFGANESSTTSSTKRLAEGMLTYADGRYPVRGNDGQTYNAQYEPSLNTGVYDGGNGKAHFGIFSEKMPEMVVSGPTTRNIQMNYPELMQAIMTIDKHGRLKNAALPTFASGNMGSFAPGTSSSATDAQAMAGLSNEQLMETFAAMTDAVVSLQQRLASPIRASINMYGTNGMKENLDKANKFYQKNKIKK